MSFCPSRAGWIWGSRLTTCSPLFCLNVQHQFLSRSPKHLKCFPFKNSKIFENFAVFATFEENILMQIQEIRHGRTCRSHRPVLDDRFQKTSEYTNEPKWRRIRFQASYWLQLLRAPSCEHQSKENFWFEPVKTSLNRFEDVKA